ncbi:MULTISPECIES: YlcI/YnfO family protein [Arthrospira]|uniref:YlcI/YnfO family protein n=1 Tax=Oscillatoriales TaxID=1150 RepID=UPI0001C3918F|nr:YlcI/YnfO family protein [Arthrospira platensis]AMW28183.1 hypothetical protein AP285_09550 [Arthrospira platensis YZ]KDR56798.1 hypothetical protein APPUASWS_014300 [Arthrospira platensis str. Paraca]MBD2668379.1 hypothetical protein [Arthrospira platensis FACHB-439]MBD2710045.1 hypothetical protein [Arthrospira platensis FACHB-835]MDF2209318.1 YlcI/YnfO family protein [Arthrospira platensis NCB002]MDT9181983.1 YlcI/YnfO family protein [Limnospira sp. PMC 289.06]MDT9294138.1 YlcI/YnfO fa
MPNPFLGVRIPSEVHEALMARVEITGQSKSDLVIDALRSYLGISSQQEKLDQLEVRLSALEFKLEQLGEESHSDD